LWICNLFRSLGPELEGRLPDWGLALGSVVLAADTDLGIADISRVGEATLFVGGAVLA